MAWQLPPDANGRTPSNPRQLFYDFIERNVRPRFGTPVLPNAFDGLIYYRTMMRGETGANEVFLVDGVEVNRRLQDQGSPTSTPTAQRAASMAQPWDACVCYETQDSGLLSNEVWRERVTLKELLDDCYLRGNGILFFTEDESLYQITPSSVAKLVGMGVVRYDAIEQSPPADDTKFGVPSLSAERMDFFRDMFLAKEWIEPDSIEFVSMEIEPGVEVDGVIFRAKPGVARDLWRQESIDIGTTITAITGQPFQLIPERQLGGPDLSR